MGEFADMLIDDIWDRMGMDEDPEDADVFPVGKTCRYCGKEYLHWTFTNGRWRLADTNGIPHTCSYYRRIRN